MLQVPDLEIPLGDTGSLWAQGADASSTPAAATSPAVVLYDDADGNAMGVTVTLAAVGAVTGLLRGELAATSGNGFEAGKTYLARVTATIGGVTHVGLGKVTVL